MIASVRPPAVPETALPVRLADIGTHGHGDSEAPYLAALVRDLTVEVSRLSAEVGRLQTELAQRPTLPALEQVLEPRISAPWWSWRRWAGWRR